MTCPICGAETKVTETRSNGFTILRRRVCTFNRYHRFVTRESWLDLRGESFPHYLQRTIQEINEDDN